MKLTVLGNCGTQTLEHDTTSFVVSCSDKHILIDCGPSVVKQLLKVGIAPQDISAIILTHCHGDHTAGYPYLLFMVNIARMTGKNLCDIKIPIIALPSLLNIADQLVNLQYPVEQLSERLVEKYPLQNNGNDTIKIDMFSIKTFPVSHTVPSIGVVIECEGKIIAYSGDTQYSEIVEMNARGSTLLVHDAFCTEQFAEMAKRFGHSTAHEAGKVAKNSGVDKLILCHPAAFVWSNPQSLIDEAKNIFSGEILLPKNFEEFEV
jgi:ribonuclease BN (tRNA processing enzyme)